MNTSDIQNKILDIIRSIWCNSSFLNIYIRFYIDKVLFKTYKIYRSYGYTFCNCSFGEHIDILINNNIKCNCFDFVNYNFKIGKIKNHGWNENFAIDTLFINFNRDSMEA